MGINLIGSSSSFDSGVGYSQNNSKNYNDFGNPKPDNYEIIESLKIGEYLIIQIRYLDCTNYEGRKIMMFDCSLNDLIKQRNIDPHFSENNNYYSPIARFEPTVRGWTMAITLAENLNS